MGLIINVGEGYTFVGEWHLDFLIVNVGEGYTFVGEWHLDFLIMNMGDPSPSPSNRNRAPRTPIY